MAYILSNEANDDLDGILNRIADDSPNAAARVARRITGTMSLLADSPGIGRRSEIDADAFEHPVARLPCLIVYEIAGPNIHILRVWHVSRQCPASWRD